MEDILEKIVKKGNKWQVQSEKGRNMGTYDTKAEAEERLRQVEYFKHMNESLDEINTGLQNLGFEHSTNGIEHLFKTDNDLSNFIRFDLDDKNKVLRIKGFGILEKGKGLGGKMIDIILSNIPNEYTVELENNFNPDFWNHIESKYPNLKFKDVKKVYEGLHVIKPEEEPKELENIVYYDDTGLNYITYKNNEVSVANRQENPIKVPHNIKEIKIDDIYTIQVTPESEFINKKHYANDSAPAIIVVENNGKYYLLEGNHRTWAREYAGKDTIKADVYKLADIVKQVHYFKYANENLLEDNRAALVNQSRNVGLYKDKSRGKNRFERKKYSKIANTVKQYNQIDMNKLFKQDTLQVAIPVVGETDNYTVTIKMEGVIEELARNMKNNNNKFEFKAIIQALTKIFNTANIYVKCNCPDYKYRFAHWNIVKNVSVDDTAQDPGPGKGIRNPKDEDGRGCKHILLCLNNGDWLMKVASVINNYVHYAEEKLQKPFLKVIFPKLYGIPAEEMVEQDLIDTDKYLKASTGLIDAINDYGRNRGKYQKGSNKNPVTGTGGRTKKEEPGEEEK